MPRQLGTLSSPDVNILDAPSLTNTELSDFGKQKATTAIAGNEDKVQQAMTGGRRLGTLSGGPDLSGIIQEGLQDKPFFPPTEKQPFPLPVSETDIGEINRLVANLGGNLPIEIPDTEEPQISEEFKALDISEPQKTFETAEFLDRFGEEEKVKGEAFAALTDPEGRFRFSPEQVQSLVAGREAARPESQKFRTIGAILGGIVAGKFIPGPADDVALAATFARLLGVPFSTATAATAGAFLDSTLDPDRDITGKELAKIFGSEFALDLAFGGAAEIGVRKFGRAARLPIDDIDDLNRLLAEAAGDPAIQRALKDEGLARVGGKLFFGPGKASNLPAAQTTDAIVSASILSSGKAARTSNRITRVARANVKRIPLQIGKVSKELDPRTVTNFAVDAIKNTEKAADDVAGVMFKEVDDFIAGTRKTKLVPEIVESAILDSTGKPITRTVFNTKTIEKGMVNYSAIAERAAKEKARLLAVKGGLPYKGKTKEVIEALLDPRPTTFSSGHDLRSFLKRTQRDLQRSTNPDSTLAKTLGIFIPMMDESMDAAGRSLGGSPAAIYKKGRQLWRSNRELYGAQVIADIIKQRPNNSKMIFSILKEGDPEQVGLVLKAVNDPKAIDKIKSGFLTGMIKESSEVTARKTAGRELVGEKLLDAWTQIPEGVRKQIYGAKADEIQNAFRILSLSEESIKSGGLVGIRAAQALGVAGLIALPIAAATGEEAEFGGRGTALSATTGVLLIGPELLASLVLKRPGFAKLLGQGFKFNRVNRQSTAALTRLGRMVLLERKSLNKKRKSIIRKQVNEVRKAKVRKELSKQAILKIR